MKLSVILPCYNGEATLATQLEALARQTWQGDWEVLVCNNGSTDRSMDVVRGYVGRLPGLRIVEAHQGSGPRRGVTHTYSVGFAAARGEAFVLCESDDEVGVGWLSALAAALQVHPFVAAALDYDRLNAEHLRPVGWKQQSAEAGLSTISGPMFWPYASGCSLGMRRSVYELLGDPDHGCGASWDTDYCWRARLAGIELQFVPEAVVHYRLRTTLGSSFRQGKSWGQGHVALQNKYRPAADRFDLLKREVRGLRELGRHLLTAPDVVSGKKTLSSWLWNLGWNVATVQHAARVP
jgi:GT2 family glycosyltransferase